MNSRLGPRTTRELRASRVLEVTDLNAIADVLRGTEISFRTEIIDGVGGRQILIEDPSGNPIELFQPTRPEASLSPPSP